MQSEQSLFLDQLDKSQEIANDNESSTDSESDRIYNTFADFSQNFDADQEQAQRTISNGRLKLKLPWRITNFGRIQSKQILETKIKVQRQNTENLLCQLGRLKQNIIRLEQQNKYLFGKKNRLQVQLKDLETKYKTEIEVLLENMKSIKKQQSYQKFQQLQNKNQTLIKEIKHKEKEYEQKIKQLKKENQQLQKQLKQKTNNYLIQSAIELGLQLNQFQGDTLDQSQKFGNCEKQNHNRQPISELCLNYQCKGVDQILCKSCKQNHEHHQTIDLLDKNILGQINSNSQHLNARKFYQFCDKKYKNIETAWTQKVQKFRKKSELFQKYRYQFLVIKQTFDKQAVENAQKAIKQKNKSEINSLAQKLKLMIKKKDTAKDYFFDQLKMQRIANYQQYKFLEIFEKRFQQISAILAQMFTDFAKQSIFDSKIDQKALQYWIPYQIINITLLDPPVQLGRKILKKVVKLKKLVKQVNFKANNKNLPMNDLSTLQKTLKMQVLQKINIQYCHETSQQILQCLIRKANWKRMKEVRFQGYGQQIPNNLLEQFIKRGKYVQYFTNQLDQFNSYEENQEFYNFVGLQNSSETPISTESLVMMSKELTNLRNVWIQRIQDQQSLIILRNMEKLTDLYLGNNYDTYYLNKQFVNELKKKYKLTNLYLTHISGCQKLVDIFEDRQIKLKKIIFDRCEGITNDLLYKIGAIGNLEQFVIYFPYQVQQMKTFQQIQKSLLFFKFEWLKDLKILSLSHSLSFDINKQKARQGLKDLTSLEFINLSWNKWVDDDLLKVIGSNLKHLMHLNIQSTDVTNIGIVEIQNLSKLRTLICGMNKIDGKSLVKALQKSKLKKLRKLSIDRLNGQKSFGNVTQKDLLQIDKSIVLTHLSAYGCKQFSGQTILILKNLKCIVFQMVELEKQKVRKIKQKGIKISNGSE